MSGDPSSRIELDDIQNGALHPRLSRTPACPIAAGTASRRRNLLARQRPETGSGLPVPQSGMQHPRADSVNGSKEFANFMILKLALDFLVELLHSISQEFHIRTRVFDLQLVSFGVMTSH
jgi:hypothetical protein